MATLGVGLFAEIGEAGSAEPEKDALAANRLLGRGVNLGNILEAPQEGAWGLSLKAEYFSLIKHAGFDAVRIPIRWSAHAKMQAPYAVDEPFFKRVDWALEQAKSSGLRVVINVHHYDEMFHDPDKHLPRLTALWKQIAERYQQIPPETLFYEVLNEPHDALSDERWDRMLPDLLKAIRELDPKRMVIVGPGHWNGIDHLDALHLPGADQRLIVTIHYYSPFEFTHQGAEWVQGSGKWKGRTWNANPQEQEGLRKAFDKAAAWAKKNNRPLFLGEFGSYSAADMTSRARWTKAVVREAERHDMSWAYWEFGAGFGVYDPAARVWRKPLREALLSDVHESKPRTPSP
jgi:endoglucanase